MDKQISNTPWRVKQNCAAYRWLHAARRIQPRAHACAPVKRGSAALDRPIPAARSPHISGRVTAGSMTGSELKPVGFSTDQNL